MLANENYGSNPIETDMFADLGAADSYLVICSLFLIVQVS